MLKTIFQDNTERAYILSTVHNKKTHYRLQLAMRRKGQMVRRSGTCMAWHVYMTAIIHNRETGFSDALK